MNFVYAIFDQSETEFYDSIASSNISSSFPILFITSQTFWDESRTLNSSVEEQERDQLDGFLFNMGISVEEIQEQTYIAYTDKETLQQTLANNENFVSCNEYHGFLKNSF